MKIKIKSTGNIILSDEAFAEQHYPGDWEVVPDESTPEPVAPLTRILTKKEMLLRITPVEYGAIKAAATVDTNVDYFWQLYTQAEEVDLDDPVTVTGFQTLEAAGIIAPGRAAEILA